MSQISWRDPHRDPCRAGIPAGPGSPRRPASGTRRGRPDQDWRVCGQYSVTVKSSGWPFVAATSQPKFTRVSVALRLT